MYWNYRVMRRKSLNEAYYYEVVEVYYNENNLPCSWSESHNLLMYEEYEDIIDAHKKIEAAFSKSILDEQQLLSKVYPS